MSTSLIPHSNSLQELTRLFRNVEERLNRISIASAAPLPGGSAFSGTRAATATLPPPVDPSTADLQAIYGRLVALETALPTKAPLDSPTFTGTPAGPTPAPGTSTNQLATCDFVRTEQRSYFPKGW